MGCGSSVIFKEVIDNVEEKMIGNLIDEIGLEEVEVRDFIVAIKKYGYFGDLTEAQMLNVKDKINYDPTNVHQQKFYSKFRTDEGKYATKQLILAGIMFCKGKVKYKAAMLYQYLDPDCNDKLESESKDQYNFEKALDWMMDLAINGITDLVETEKLAKVQFQSDLSAMNEKYSSEVGRISEVMFDDPDGEIKLTEFVSCFKKNYPWVLSARGVRYTLHPDRPKDEKEQELELKHSIKKDDFLEIPNKKKADQAAAEEGKEEKQKDAGEPVVASKELAA